MVDWWSANITRISYRWQTHATRCIMANVLQTSKADAQCDKLATKLSWQFFTSKVANFQPPHLHLIYPTCISRLHWGWPRLSFAEHQKRRVPGLLWGIVCMIPHLAVSVEYKLVQDRQTDTRRQLITALASVMRVKIRKKLENPHLRSHRPR